MRNRTIYYFIFITSSVFLSLACSNTKTTGSETKSNRANKEQFIKENIKFATAQTELMLQRTGKPTTKNYPHSIKNDSTIQFTNITGWTSGFFPGTLWYLYELTREDKWKTTAELWTNSLEGLKSFTDHHDLGFMVYCSYGNAERLAPKPEYKGILLESAQSLSTRFDKKTGLIKSWNSFKPWSDSVVYTYPVIIDNMMNLEMLFYASRIAENKDFYNIAGKHSVNTLENHFRDDFSTYHVVSYDANGNVLSKNTAQGYSDNSTWARGQAWAIYGFTMTYRETKDKRYLEAATKAADYYLSRLPEDLIPLWDFNVGMEDYTPSERSYASKFEEKLRDASAAAITCSALFELGELSKNTSYTQKAIDMLYSLASPKYRTELGTNTNFLIKHCVGSIPHKSEIDKPLVYADYYFLEALVRYRNLK